MLLITTLASAGVTYTMLRYFPQRIMVDSKGNVNIDGGNVSIWSSGGSKIQSKKK